MSPLIEDLHDIEGLDAISVWPLALGWWILIALGIVILGGAIWLLIRRLKYLRSWERDTLKRLDNLEKNLSPLTSKETVVLLSEYLRRIAIRRFPRKECAGLVGSSWLNWLKAHDLQQFDWVEKGKLLIEVPYAPLHQELVSDEIKELIKAVRNWVR